MSPLPVEVFHPERLLSAFNASHLLSWVDDCLSTKHTALLVDLEYAAFMDSTGLGTLVIAQQRVQQAGGQFALCSVTGQARMLLEMTGMEQAFVIYENQQAFVEAMRSTHPHSQL